MPLNLHLPSSKRWWMQVWSKPFNPFVKTRLFHMISRRHFSTLIGASLSTAAAPSFAQIGRPKLALVLGAGSARGFAHIGIIKALDAAGIKPDLIVGASAGSVIGVFYAAGYTGLQMENVAMKVRDADVIDTVANTKRGLVGGEALQKLINNFVKDKSIKSRRCRPSGTCF